MEARTVAKILVERFISVLGTPCEIHSDQGTSLESSVFHEVCRLLGVIKTRISPYNPQSDGMIERMNRTLKNMLMSFVSKNQKDWDVHIPLLMMAYRSSVHEATGMSPSLMMLGREIRLPVDIAMGQPEKSTNRETDMSEYAYKLHEKMEKIHEIARDKLEISTGAMKKYYDKKTSTHTYKLGDPVWYFWPQHKTGLGRKLLPKWQGPFVVTEKLTDILYKIQDKPGKKPRIVHSNKLAPYIGDNAPAWFRTHLGLDVC